jgi:hypothetical protein
VVDEDFNTMETIMDDLILSVVKDRQWSDIDCYALSLAKTGYKGRKVMYVENVTTEAQENLKALGFEVYQFSGTKPNLHFQTYRYQIAEIFLQEHGKEFSRVLWTDVCDLVFQTDPSNMPVSRLLAAKEGWKIKDQAINDVWIKRCGGDYYSSLREEEVLCSGTIAGSSVVIETLFRDIVNYSHDSMQGIDQGLFNFLARQKPYSDYLGIPEMSEGWVCTCGPFLAPSDPKTWTIDPPVFDRSTGLVMTPDGSKAFTIMHQYNRNYGQFDPSGDWRGIVERKYRNDKV